MLLNLSREDESGVLPLETALRSGLMAHRVREAILVDRGSGRRFLFPCLLRALCGAGREARRRRPAGGRRQSWGQMFVPPALGEGPRS